MASISIRESIRWLPEEATEATTTIVLTSPEKRFVDLRIFNPEKAESKDEVPLERLDWAMAGTSSSVAIPERGPDATRSQWVHWIDSRTLDVENATDEGYMSPLDGNRVLEEGTMMNPETGLQTDYEEIWNDEEPKAVPSDTGSHIVVLDYQGNDGAAQRGRVVKLGKYCQGLLRDGDAITAERWEWRQDRGWYMSKNVNKSTQIPCEHVLDNWNKAKGTTFEYSGRTWTVIESE
ncbi:hypothetical protein PFICI_06681 [Pestalotiopsis fici W106-1]|uniref:Protein HRI1 n=1 Tax=Pestalotiopsis fici (strain W106-1 / CGMCC3.15140) TaxID=1229662 RepID=W3X6K8_PESFW|nr:uncharacterized protein PFICI_06681 [Pestalotiopsis fici W106-1]ETS81679.1 hypothetical protein PFICI_06681 [Pestalotiopsis fici W106-1]